MRHVCGQDDEFTSLGNMRLAINQYFSFAINYIYQRIEWRCVFTQPLTLVKRKHSQSAGFLLQNLAADNRAREYRLCRAFEATR
jgi:hypothetical protein